MVNIFIETEEPKIQTDGILKNISLTNGKNTSGKV
jgi:hypothetical protein